MIGDGSEIKKKQLFTVRYQPLLTVSFYLEYQNVN